MVYLEEREYCLERNIRIWVKLGTVREEKIT